MPYSERTLRTKVRSSAPFVAATTTSWPLWTVFVIRCSDVIEEGIFEVTVPGRGHRLPHRGRRRGSPTTPTGTCRHSANSTSSSSARAGTSDCGQCSARTRAKMASPSRSGRPTPRVCGWSATSPAGVRTTAGRCARWAAAACGSCSFPDASARPAYKYRLLGRDGVWREKADPLARYAEVPDRTASRHLPVRLRLGRRRVARPTRRRCALPRAGQHLRGAPGLVAPRDCPMGPCPSS